LNKTWNHEQLEKNRSKEWQRSLLRFYLMGFKAEESRLKGTVENIGM
jgi:hypothetical protein